MWEWEGGGSLSLAGVADLPFGTDEKVVVERMRSELGEPSSYEVSAPREFGEGGCFRKHRAVLTYGNLTLRFFEGRLGLWSLEGNPYAGFDGAVSGLEPADGVSLGEKRPDIDAARTADQEDFFHFYGQEFASDGHTIAKADTAEDATVVRITTIHLPVADCVLVD